MAHVRAKKWGDHGRSCHPYAAALDSSRPFLCALGLVYQFAHLPEVMPIFQCARELGLAQYMTYSTM